MDTQRVVHTIFQDREQSPSTAYSLADNFNTRGDNLSRSIESGSNRIQTCNRGDRGCGRGRGGRGGGRGRGGRGGGRSRGNSDRNVSDQSEVDNKIMMAVQRNSSENLPVTVGGVVNWQAEGRGRGGRGGGESKGQDNNLDRLTVLSSSRRGGRGRGGRGRGGRGRGDRGRGGRGRGAHQFSRGILRPYFDKKKRDYYYHLFPEDYESFNVPVQFPSIGLEDSDKVILAELMMNAENMHKLPCTDGKKGLPQSLATAFYFFQIRDSLSDIAKKWIDDLLSNTLMGSQRDSLLKSVYRVKYRKKSPEEVRADFQETEASFGRTRVSLRDNLEELLMQEGFFPEGYVPIKKREEAVNDFNYDSIESHQIRADTNTAYKLACGLKEASLAIFNGMIFKLNDFFDYMYIKQNPRSRFSKFPTSFLNFTGMERQDYSKSLQERNRPGAKNYKRDIYLAMVKNAFSEKNKGKRMKDHCKLIDNIHSQNIGLYKKLQKDVKKFVSHNSKFMERKHECMVELSNLRSMSDMYPLFEVAEKGKCKITFNRQNISFASWEDLCRWVCTVDGNAILKSLGFSGDGRILSSTLQFLPTSCVKFSANTTFLNNSIGLFGEPLATSPFLKVDEDAGESKDGQQSYKYRYPSETNYKVVGKSDLCVREKGDEHGSYRLFHEFVTERGKKGKNNKTSLWKFGHIPRFIKKLLYGIIRLYNQCDKEKEFMRNRKKKKTCGAIKAPKVKDSRMKKGQDDACDVDEILEEKRHDPKSTKCDILCHCGRHEEFGNFYTRLDDKDKGYLDRFDLRKSDLHVVGDQILHLHHKKHEEFSLANFQAPCCRNEDGKKVLPEPFDSPSSGDEEGESKGEWINDSHSLSQSLFEFSRNRINEHLKMLKFKQNLIKGQLEVKRNMKSEEDAARKLQDEGASLKEISQLIVDINKLLAKRDMDALIKKGVPCEQFQRPVVDYERIAEECQVIFLKYFCSHKGKLHKKKKFCIESFDANMSFGLLGYMMNLSSEHSCLYMKKGLDEKCLKDFQTLKKACRLFGNRFTSIDGNISESRKMVLCNFWKTVSERLKNLLVKLIDQKPINLTHYNPENSPYPKTKISEFKLKVPRILFEKPSRSKFDPFKIKKSKPKKKVSKVKCVGFNDFESWVQGIRKVQSSEPVLDLCSNPYDKLYWSDDDDDVPDDWEDMYSSGDDDVPDDWEDLLVGEYPESDEDEYDKEQNAHCHEATMNSYFSK